MLIFEYKLFRWNTISGYLTALQSLEATGEGYVSSDLVIRDYKKALAEGFRWVRTDNGFIVMERETHIGP
jgi:hypothetical protein